MAGYVTGDLVTDLWWFIENVTDEDQSRHDQFFASFISLLQRRMQT